MGPLAAQAARDVLPERAHGVLHGAGPGAPGPGRGARTSPAWRTPSRSRTSWPPSGWSTRAACAWASSTPRPTSGAWWRRREGRLPWYAWSWPTRRWPRSARCPQALRSLLTGADAVDAIWIPPDPVLLGEESQRHLLAESLKAGKPVYAFSSSLVAEGRPGQQRPRPGVGGRAGGGAGQPPGCRGEGEDRDAGAARRARDQQDAWPRSSRSRSRPTCSKRRRESSDGGPGLERAALRRHAARPWRPAPGQRRHRPPDEAGPAVHPHQAAGAGGGRGPAGGRHLGRLFLRAQRAPAARAGGQAGPLHRRPPGQARGVPGDDRGQAGAHAAGQLGHGGGRGPWHAAAGGGRPVRRGGRPHPRPQGERARAAVGDERGDAHPGPVGRAGGGLRGEGGAQRHRRAHHRLPGSGAGGVHVGRGGGAGRGRLHRRRRRAQGRRGGGDQQADDGRPAAHASCGRRSPSPPC